MKSEKIHKTKEDDLEVIIQDNLSLGKHVNIIAGGTGRLLIDMKVAFSHMVKEVLRYPIVSKISNYDYAWMYIVPSTFAEHELTEHEIYDCTNR